MMILKFIFPFIVIGLCSCGQKTRKHKVDSTAVQLNYSAMELVKFIQNSDSSKKAVELLDIATSIDSNYYLGYFNKLMFLSRLKQFNKAIITTNNLIRIRPDAHDLYIIAGIFCEKKNDTISSKDYFYKSLRICNSVLDTMNFKNNDYEMLMINKSVNLIMLNRNEEANALLKKLSESQSDGEMKKITLSMINLNKEQLIDKYYSGKNGH